MRVATAGNGVDVEAASGCFSCWQGFLAHVGADDPMGKQTPDGECRHRDHDNGDDGVAASLLLRFFL